METFSTGDYFRGVLKNSNENSTPFVKELKQKLESGALVDDKTVVEVVREYSKEQEKKTDIKGTIYDGVPRTLDQAKQMSEFLKIDLVVNFIARDEILLMKLTGRRVCPSCNYSYNVAEVNTEDGY